MLAARGGCPPRLTAGVLALCAAASVVAAGHGQRRHPLDATEPLSRGRRGVVYVQGSILQFAFGLQVPTSVPNKTVNINLGLQANYMLPGNASQFHRARRCEQGAELRDIYRQLEGLLAQHGYVPSRECLLRSVCEAAAVKFAGGLFEEILHMVLTPSGDSSSSPEDVFVKAESLGRTGASCRAEFPACNVSPLEVASEVAI